MPTETEYMEYRIESTNKSIKLFQKWRDSKDFNNADIEYKTFVIGTLNQLIAFQNRGYK